MKIKAVSIIIEGFHSFHTMINRTRRKDIEDFCIRRTQTVKVPFNSIQKILRYFDRVWKVLLWLTAW